MRGYVTSVDRSWYATIRSRASVDEVNAWRPGTQNQFRAVRPGEPVFLRLKSPHDRIVGAGFFSHASILPVSTAWRIFGDANGEKSFIALKEKLVRLRSQLGMSVDKKSDPELGCVLLLKTVLFDEDDWVHPPADLDDRAGRGKIYDLSSGEGRQLWSRCRAKFPSDEESVTGDGIAASRFGPGSFRVAVIDAWNRRCAVTGEGVLPALEAVQIRPSTAGSYSLSNSILLRSDLAALFEAGYVTINSDHVLLVSEGTHPGETGRDYQRLHGTGLRLPSDPSIRPDPELLWWHQKEMFLG